MASIIWASGWPVHGPARRRRRSSGPKAFPNITKDGLQGANLRANRKLRTLPISADISSFANKATRKWARGFTTSRARIPPKWANCHRRQTDVCGIKRSKIVRTASTGARSRLRARFPRSSSAGVAAVVCGQGDSRSARRAVLSTSLSIAGRRHIVLLRGERLVYARRGDSGEALARNVCRDEPAGRHCGRPAMRRSIG